MLDQGVFRSLTLTRPYRSKMVQIRPQQEHTSSVTLNRTVAGATEKHVEGETLVWRIGKREGDVGWLRSRFPRLRKLNGKRNRVFPAHRSRMHDCVVTKATHWGIWCPIPGSWWILARNDSLSDIDSPLGAGSQWLALAGRSKSEMK